MSVDDLSVIYTRDLTDQLEDTFEKVLKRTKVHTLDVPLVPIDTIRLTLGTSTATFLFPNVEFDYRPDTHYRVIVNVESGTIRYSDSVDVQAGTLGEVYSTGATFMRYLDTINGVNFCAESGAAIVNVSLYHD